MDDNNRETGQRLDRCLMDRGFSREYAQEVIAAGLVLVRGKVVLKPGRKTAPGDVEVLAPEMPFAGRGGYKLDGAITAFGIELNGCVCLDAGASTGGFTDCMLKHGASRVYAVDVGSAQLIERLRIDSRVISMENTDIRGLILPEAVDFAAVDVSFISLVKVIPSLQKLVKPNGGLVCLIKPQFETDRSCLSKKGVVTDAKRRVQARDSVTAALAINGFNVVSVMESPITGRSGNVEYLSYALNNGRQR